MVDVPDPVALHYRDRGNRSLSIGDVVAIEDDHGVRWYGCAHLGWDQLTAAPSIQALAQHGTTPVAAPPVHYTVRFTEPVDLAGQLWQVAAVSRFQLHRRVVEHVSGQLGLDKARMVIRARDRGRQVWNVNSIEAADNFRLCETTITSFTAQPDTQGPLN